MKTPIPSSGLSTNGKELHQAIGDCTKRTRRPMARMVSLSCIRYCALESPFRRGFRKGFPGQVELGRSVGILGLRLQNRYRDDWLAISPITLLGQNDEAYKASDAQAFSGLPPAERHWILAASEAPWRFAPRLNRRYRDSLRSHGAHPSL
jgi:hypothetical protein